MTEIPTTWRIKVVIKRSQRDIPIVPYEDDLDELDQPKHCRYGANCILGQCNCIEEEGEQVPDMQSPVICANDKPRLSEDHCLI